MAAPMGNDVEVFCPCNDFMHFEDALKKLRINDDKIVYALNNVIPTQSFASKVDVASQCKSLYEQMTRTYGGREKAIQKCVNDTTEEVEQWRQRRLENRDDDEALNNLRKAQSKLRLMQRELEIEKVVQDRSYKIFYERCRNAYTPPNPKPIV